MVTVDEIKNGIQSNAGAIAIGAGVGIVGAGILGAAIIGSKSKKKARSSRGRKRDRKMFNKSQKWEIAYRNRKRKLKRKSKRNSKRKSRGKVKYTKNGQPYIILSSGKARFIKGKRRAK